MRSRRYMEALKNERYLEDTNILDTDAFLELVKAFTSARKNGLTECALIKVTESSKGKRKTARKLGETLRQTDYFGIVDDYLYVLLSNTDEANAQKVLDRFRQNWQICLRRPGRWLPYESGRMDLSACLYCKYSDRASVFFVWSSYTCLCTKILSGGGTGNVV